MCRKKHELHVPAGTPGRRVGHKAAQESAGFPAYFVGGLSLHGRNEGLEDFGINVGSHGLQRLCDVVGGRSVLATEDVHEVGCHVFHRHLR